MKCTNKQARTQKAVNYAMSLKIDELWEDIQTQIAQQLIAAMLYTLEVSEDYEPQDMRRVFDELSSTFDDMRGVGFVPEFDGDDLMQRCKERYGIDLEAEVKVGKHKNKG